MSMLRITSQFDTSKHPEEEHKTIDPDILCAFKYFSKIAENLQCIQVTLEETEIINYPTCAIQSLVITIRGWA